MQSRAARNNLVIKSLIIKQDLKTSTGFADFRFWMGEKRSSVEEISTRTTFFMCKKNLDATVKARFIAYLAFQQIRKAFIFLGTSPQQDLSQSTTYDSFTH